MRRITGDSILLTWQPEANKHNKIGILLITSLRLSHKPRPPHVTSEFRMTRKKKIILTTLGVVVFLMLISAALAPTVVKNWLTGQIQRSTGRAAHLQSLTFNPLTMTVRAEKFALDERSGGPFLSVGSFRASLSPLSLFRGAIILSRLDIEKPVAMVTRHAPNHYNFSDIIQRIQANSKPKSNREIHFSLNNISIIGGSLDFNDLATANGRRHTVRNFDIGIPFISDIPFLAEKYIDPKLSATVNGAHIVVNGKMKPFSKSLETSLHLKLDRLDLPELVAYSPVKPPITLSSGKFSLDSSILYRIYADKKPDLEINGLFRLDDLAINLNNGAKLLKLPLLEVSGAQLGILARNFIVGKIRFDAPELFVSRDKKGRWMYESLLSPVPENKAKTVKKNSAPASPPLSARIDSVAIGNGVVHINDALPTGGFSTRISGIALAVNNAGTAPGKAADYSLSLKIDNEADLASKGNFTAEPLELKTATKLTGLRIQKGWPYLAAYLASSPKGVLELSGDVNYSKKDGLRAEHAHLELKDLAAHYGVKEGFNLGSLAINNVSYLQSGNHLEIEGINLSRGSMSLSREMDGQLSLMTLLKPVSPRSPHAAVPGKAPKTAASAPFSYRLKQFHLDRFNLAFTDKSREGKPRFSVRNNTITLSNLNGPRFTAIPLRYSAIYGGNSPIRVSGQLSPLPFHFKGRIGVGRLPIRDFEDYFPDNLNVAVLDGKLDTAVTLDVGMKNGKPVGGFTGNVGIRSFHSIDTVEEQDLLKWESLQLDEFKGNLEPFSISMRQIALNGVYSRIIVFKNGTLNLQNLMEQPSPPPAQATSSPAMPVAAPGASPRPQPAAIKPKISIGSVTIQGGTLAFTDNHLPQQFSSTFYNLGGRISGMSSDDSRLADVDLRGNLENHSPLKITGNINPLRDDLFVDLKISFNDVELSPTTPYSGTYLGYTVEKGKLFLDLAYHIEHKQLRSDNKIFIDQFTFGDKVESKQATNLPVRLGLALLKDRKGEIHLDVPVTGRTDDPEFSVWGLVFQVIKNLLVKAATSPFSLLSSMFGEGKDLSTVEFAPGASAFTKEEMGKLDTLAKALADRPALKIELKGYVDREKDPEGYRVELLNRKMLNEKKLALARERDGSESQPLDMAPLSAAEYSRYLKLVYKKEKFPKPRNVLGLIKDLPDAEMKKLILANTAITNTDLQTLAQDRAAKVMDYLVKNGGIPAERIFLKKDDIGKAPEKASQTKSRVEMNAVAP